MRAASRISTGLHRKLYLGYPEARRRCWPTCSAFTELGRKAARTQGLTRLTPSCPAHHASKTEFHAVHRARFPWNALGT